MLVHGALRFTAIFLHELHAFYTVYVANKYRNPSALRIVCDAIILNEKGEVLLQERTPDLKLKPDYLTLPGGGVDRFDVPLETELAREVLEETGIDISELGPKLLDSRIGKTTITRRDEHLDVAYPVDNSFLWNTYLVHGVSSNTALTPGDDCQELLWVPVKDALRHGRVSPEAREILKKAQA